MEQKLKQLAISLCKDYPNIETCTPLEHLDALEGCLRGTMAANYDLICIIRAIQEKYEITTEELKSYGK